MLRYRQGAQRVVSEGKKDKSESVSMMERGRVRDAVTCEWFSKSQWQEAVNVEENKKEGWGKKGRGDNLLPM